jgi:cytochrome o ubiquinol oxidase subunit 3
MNRTLATTTINTTELYRDTESKTMLGFWIYIMTDCVLFASLFATYAVLHKSTFGGPTAQSLFNMRYVLLETIILLTSSFTCGLAILSLRKNDKNKVLFWLGITFILGLGFLIMELTEFRHFTEIGASWQTSGFLSSYFTLVGTHGLHITVGLFWMLILMIKLAATRINDNSIRRLTLLSIFWHFLDIIWIFIFTIVYLLGALGK